MIRSISDLQVGQKILVEAGYGYPAAADTVEHVVLQVHGNSALTQSGVRLACCNSDELGISLLAALSVRNPKPSTAAKKILEEVKRSQSRTRMH